MNNKDLIKADDLFLYIYSGDTAQVVAFATSCSLNVNQDAIDCSSKVSCRWNDNLPGKMSYDISADALYTQKSGAYSFDSMMASMIAGEPVDWAIGMAQEETGVTCDNKTFALDETKEYYTGTAMISSLSLEAGNGDIAQCSISLQGCGEITPHAA